MVEVWLQLLAVAVLLLLFLVLGLTGIVWALWRLVLSLRAAVVELREVASGGRRGLLYQELADLELQMRQDNMVARERDEVATRRGSR
jgi:uncharacterized membrane protein YgcG